MSVAAEITDPRPRPTAADRLAAAFLIVVLAAGCAVIWVGIPIAGMWGLGKLTDSSAAHFLIALVAIPSAILAVLPLLFWVNGLYLRVTAAFQEDDEEDDEEGMPRRGPLEAMLLVCLAIALVALFVWFFVFAENPPRQVI